MLTRKKFIIIVIIVIVSIILFVVGELLYIMMNGKAVDAPNIPRTTQELGSSGPALKYVVLGDSTSIGQGTEYKNSYTYQTAEQLAKEYKVSLTNIGVSGARAIDVQKDQLPKAVDLKPDVVLLAVGANDVTHFTSNGTFEKLVQSTIDGLRKDNCNLKIVVTGSPAMGSVSRFPFGARQLAGYRERQLNSVYARLITKNHLYSAPVALRTGPAFAADPTLFAQDNFHPNARGYALWTPVINEALDKALASKSVDCSE